MDLDLRKVLIGWQEKSSTWKTRLFEIDLSDVCGCLFAESYLTLQPHQGLELQENATQSQPPVGQRGRGEGRDTHLGNVNSTRPSKFSKCVKPFEVPPYGAIFPLAFVLAFSTFSWHYISCFMHENLFPTFQCELMQTWPRLINACVLTPCRSC